MRLLIAGGIAGFVVFVWSFVSHVLLPIGDAGFRELPGEASVIAAMEDAAAGSGLYMFHYFHYRDRDTATEAEIRAAEEAYVAGPRAFIVYRTDGAPLFSVDMLLVELLSTLAAGVLAAFLVSRTALAGLAGRASFVSLLGLFSFLVITVSQWNWYGFPPSFSVAEGVDQVVGWFLGGLVLGKMERSGAR